MKEMNLLPEEYLYEQKQKRGKRLFIGLAIIFVLILILFYLGVYWMEYNMDREINKVKAETESLEKVRAAQMEISVSQDALEGRLHLLETIDNQRVDHFQFIKDIKKALPEEIILSSIAHPGGRNFNIRGAADHPEKIVDFIVNLAKIEGVADVLLDHVNYGNTQEDQDPSFSIYLTYPMEEGGEVNDDLKQ